ncbi:MAG: tRNA (guanosine(46)-N7)-methyltransferase TrmB [Bacilli bacterium]|nr:tRNA (guanosine(46)-N7)-methyltransferase TrmB [Bacilli bacterium]
MRGRHKAWAAPFLADHRDIAIETVDPNDPFFASSPLFLEVGIGKGDFIIGMASRFPGHYLGLEKEISIAGIAAKKVVASGLDNIRLRADDFDDVYPEIETLRFDKIFLNFSDPWPKKKHAKRRLTAAPRLNQMGALLKEGGFIVIKTDNDILYEFTLEEIEKTKLTLVVNLFDYSADESGDVQSEYEKNFRSLGQPIHRIILKK